MRLGDPEEDWHREDDGMFQRLLRVTGPRGPPLSANDFVIGKCANMVSKYAQKHSRFAKPAYLIQQKEDGYFMDAYFYSSTYHLVKG